MNGQWIPVSASLPAEYTDVLVYRPLAHRMPANDKNVDIKQHCEGGRFRGLHEVTHWMPLPEAPAPDDDTCIVARKDLTAY